MIHETLLKLLSRWGLPTEIPVIPVIWGASAAMAARPNSALRVVADLALTAVTVNAGRIRPRR
jgi:hypothetical protein